MDKATYLARAKAEVAKAGKRIPQYAGGCEECRFSRKGLLGMRCSHPAVGCAAFNLTDAYAREEIQECSEQRDRASLWGPVLCGPDGALFERKPKLIERIAEALGVQSERIGA